MLPLCCFMGLLCLALNTVIGTLVLGEIDDKRHMLYKKYNNISCEFIKFFVLQLWLAVLIYWIYTKLSEGHIQSGHNHT